MSFDPLIFSSFLKFLRQLVSDKEAVRSFEYDYSGAVASEEMNFFEDGLSRLFRRLEYSGMGMNFFSALPGVPVVKVN